MNKEKPNNDKPEWPLNSEVVDREFVKKKGQITKIKRKQKRPNNLRGV